jgi:hypothetical protein
MDRQVVVWVIRFTHPTGWDFTGQSSIDYQQLAGDGQGPALVLQVLF